MNNMNQDPRLEASMHLILGEYQTRLLEAVKQDILNVAYARHLEQKVKTLEVKIEELEARLRVYDEERDVD